MQKKPDQIARDRINARSRKALIESGARIGRLTDAQKKPPSQRRSENARKKDLKRAGISSKPEYPGDCFNCPKEPCGKDIRDCDERSMVHPCLQCGQKVRHRIVEGMPWMHCPVCRGG